MHANRLSLARRFPLLCGALAGAASLACAGPSWGRTLTDGRLVGVSVEVEGERTPLYPDPRGTGRLYVEAREGARYALRLENRTANRIGVAVSVDGLNVISGERTDGRPRMYVLDPWGTTVIRGWRSSLQDVRRFTFVDEKASYATRSGKANGRMGWIEVSVYREQGQARVCCLERGPMVPQSGAGADKREDGGRAESQAEPPSPPSFGAPPPVAATPAPSTAPPPADEDSAMKDTDRRVQSAPRAARPRSFPGTGWGAPASDQAVVVSFDAEATPAERLTFRYEYASALRALGIRVWPHPETDRLAERERGVMGFAQPPARD